MFWSFFISTLNREHGKTYIKQYRPVDMLYLEDKLHIFAHTAGIW